MFVNQEPVILLAGAPQHLQRNDEQHNADARAGEVALGGDLPGLGDEAGVDGVPVPEHLQFGGLDDWSRGYTDRAREEAYRNLTTMPAHTHSSLSRTRDSGGGCCR